MNPNVCSAPKVEVVTRKSGPGAVYAAAGLGVVGLALVAGCVAWRATRKTPESVMESAEILQSSLKVAAAEKEVSAVQLESDKARSAHQQLVKDCQLLRTQVDEFSRRFLVYHSRIGEVLQSEAGNRIAASDGLILEYELLRGAQAPAPVDGGRLMALAHDVEGRCAAAVAMQGVIAGPVRQDAEMVAEQLARVAVADEALAGAERALSSLVKRAEAVGAGPTNLAEALRLRREQQDAGVRSRLKEEADRIAKKEADEKAKVLAAGLERKAAKDVEALQAQLRQAEDREALRLQNAEQAHLQEVAKLKAESAAQLEKQAADAAAARLKFDRDMERAEREAQRVREEMAAERLTMRCSSPEVRQVLAPFLAAGYWQPSDQMDDRIEKRPISLSLLQGCQALSPTAVGLGKLYEIAASGADRERPRWRAYDTAISADHIKGSWFVDHPEALELAKQAQAMLVELGPHLVARNMLAK
jgi:hypothetical protein